MAIVGEPGVGKSRLAAGLREIAGDGARVLTGRCPAYGEGITYWPLREIVLQAMGERSVDELAATLGLAPSVARNVAAAVGLEAGTTGEDTGWAFLRLIDALAREQPLIMVVDDAHLAEPALLDLLLDVAAGLGDAPALIVWVARPDLLDRHPDRARRIGAQNVLALGPLSDAASVALLESIAGGRLEPGEQRRIAEAAAGNPLFLEQLVAYFLERPPSAEGLPPALHALLAARLDRLDATERSALALGAIAGDAFAAGSVHALADGITRAELEQACDRLVRRDLLVRAEAGTDPGVLRFRHGLVREAAYASLAKAARARLHERRAAWLEGLGGELPEADARIAFHLEAACRYEQEIGPGAAGRARWRGRGAGSRRRRAWRAGAETCWARSASSTGRSPCSAPTGSRVSRCCRRWCRRSRTRAPRTAQRSSRIWRCRRAPRSASRAAGARSAIERERIRLWCHPESFDVAAAVAVVEHASETLRDGGDELGLARAAYLMSDLTWLMGDPVVSYADAERMLAHARRAGSGFDVATALIFLAWGLVEGPWPVAEALVRCDGLAARPPASAPPS